MADMRPDRLSNNRRSPHFDVDALRRGVGIRFKGREREDVEEYCASEGWIRVAAGKAVDRHGAPVTVKLNGEIETWWRDEGEGESGGGEDGEDYGGRERNRLARLVPIESLTPGRYQPRHRFDEEALAALRPR